MVNYKRKRKRKQFKRKSTKRRKRPSKLRVRRKRFSPRNRYVLNALPKVYFVKHTYSDSFSFKPQYDSVITNKPTLDTVTFRANNLVDPHYLDQDDMIKGGHQPMGFDEISMHYRRYIVCKATCTIEPLAYASGATSSNHTTIYTGIMCHKHLKSGEPQYPISVGHHGVVNLEQLFEQGSVRYKKWDHTSHFRQLKSLRSQRQTSVYNARRRLGKGFSKEPDYWMDKGEYESVNSLSPDTKKNYYFTAWCVRDPLTSSTTLDISYRVKITYHTMWFEKNSLHQS